MTLNDLLEAIAVISAVAYVILAARSNRWCFLFGFISSLLYIYITFFLKFYFDTAINSYYLAMSVAGWYMWGNEQNKLSISSMSMQNFLLLTCLGFCSTFLLAYMADQYSNASLPYLDAFTTVFSIIATWMVVKKYLKNWLIWIVVDLIASGMYFYKELYLTGILFILYTVLAIYGYLNWKKKVKHE